MLWTLFYPNDLGLTGKKTRPFKSYPQLFLMSTLDSCDHLLKIILGFVYLVFLSSWISHLLSTHGSLNFHVFLDQYFIFTWLFSIPQYAPKLGDSSRFKKIIGWIHRNPRIRDINMAFRTKIPEMVWPQWLLRQLHLGISLQSLCLNAFI